MPQFTVDRKALAEELGVIQAAVARKETIPVLSFCLFEVSGDKAKITGTDLDVTIVASVPVSDSDGDWAFAVPSRVLYNLVTLFDEGHICFEEEKGRIRVRCGSSKHLLPSLELAAYPQIEKIGKASVVIVPAQTFRQMVKSTMLAIVSDVNDQRVHYRSLHLTAKKGLLELTASNGKYLANTSVAIATQTSLSVLIPHRAAQVLGSFCDSEENVQIQVSENHAQFVTGNRRMLARLNAGKFPDWKQIIPTETSDRARLISSELALVIKRACVTVEGSRFIRAPLSFEFGKRLKIESPDGDHGTSTESISIDCPSMNGSKWATRIHGTQVLDFLKVADSEQVFCEFWKKPKVVVTPAKPELGIEERTNTYYYPLRFTPLDSPVNFQYFTMPLRD